jgi:hypothetical protein
LFLATTVIAEPIRLMRADQGRQMSYGGRVFRELKGDVWVKHKDMDFYFENGKHNLQLEILHCWDNVRILREGRELTADQVTFYQDDERMRSYGNVHTTGDSIEIWCEEGNWWDGLSYGELEKQVHIIDSRRQMELFAGYVEVEYDQENYSASINPVLHRHGDSPVQLDARYIRWIGDSTTAIAYGDVVLRTEEFTGYCDSLVWQDERGLAGFFGSPRLEREERKITGEMIYAYIIAEVLDSLNVLGDAKMESASDSVSTLLKDVIEGDWIAMGFNDGDLEHLRVRGRARSVFFMNDDRGLPGMNVADAARMDFWIEANSLKSIDMAGKVNAMWIPLQRPPEYKAEENSNPEDDELPGETN